MKWVLAPGLTMRRPIDLLGLARLLLYTALAATPAPATPSLSGSTGLIVIPSALTLGQKEVDIAADTFKVKPESSPSFSFTSFRAMVGLLDRPDSGLEIGVIKPEAKLIGLHDAYAVLKYRVPGILQGGALAIGATISTDKHNYTSAYVVGSSSIIRNVTLHYGGGVNIYGDPRGFAFFGGRSTSERADPAFAIFGAEFDIRRFKINAEYNGSYVSYGVNYFPESFFSLSAYKLGRGDFERMLDATNGLGLGATVRF
jgi:hypothetical protein